MCSVRTAADEAHARYSAARSNLLRAVAGLLSSEEWRGDGAANLAGWLAARWQISGRNARELVRDAEALRPELRDALSAGSISIDQFKALTVVSDEDNDSAWLEALPFWSISELEREARKTIARELEKTDDGVYLRTEHTRDERYLRGEFQLRPEDGAVLIAALDARVPKGTALRDWDRASALALVELAKGSDASSTVVVSLDDDLAALSSKGYVGAETVRRLSCDARVQAVTRTSRTVSPAMRRAVEVRDHGECVFPGCGLDRYLECHHILPVARGGPTELANLVLLCWKHHKLVHEGRWAMTGEAGTHATWLRPDGSPFEPRVRVSLDTS